MNELGYETLPLHKVTLLLITQALPHFGNSEHAELNSRLFGVTFTLKDCTYTVMGRLACHTEYMHEQQVDIHRGLGSTSRNVTIVS